MAQNPYQGAGGKIRTNRRGRTATSTPYDRPQTGRHAPLPLRYNNNNASWFSKILDPASRLLYNGAARLFSPFFRKRLTAAASSSHVTAQETLDGLITQEDVPQDDINDINLNAVQQNGGVLMSSHEKTNESYVCELERIFENKTLSREEFNRLSELLQSRVADRNIDEINTSVPGSESRKSSLDATKLTEERHNVEQMDASVHRNNSLGNSESSLAVWNGNAATSPVDVAKAYVDGLHHKPSPLSNKASSNWYESKPNSSKMLSLAPTRPGYTLNFRSQKQTDEIYKTPSAQMPNGFQDTNPSPYNVMRRKQHGIDVPHASSSTFHWTPMKTPLTGDKQVLKRRFADVDEAPESGSSIRRIKQKSNMFATPSRSVTGLSSASLQPGFPPQQSLRGQELDDTGRHIFTSKDGTHVQSQTQLTDGDLLASSRLVPQSSATAQKILDQLDRLKPTPRETSPEVQLAVARSKSPTPLTSNMLKGPAQRAIESIGSLPLHKKLDGMDKSIQSSSVGFGEENRGHGNKGKTPITNSVSITPLDSPPPSQFMNTAPETVRSESGKMDSMFSGQAKSRGFQMRAPEVEESDDESTSPQIDKATVNQQCAENEKKESTPDATESDTNKSSAAGVLSRIPVSARPTALNSSAFTFPVNSSSSTSESPPTPTMANSPVCKTVAEQVGGMVKTLTSSSVSPMNNGPIFSFSTNTSNAVDAGNQRLDLKLEDKSESGASVVFSVPFTSKITPVSATTGSTGISTTFATAVTATADISCVSVQNFQPNPFSQSSCLGNANAAESENVTSSAGPSGSNSSAFVATNDSSNRVTSIVQNGVTESAFSSEAKNSLLFGSGNDSQAVLKPTEVDSIPAFQFRTESTAKPVSLPTFGQASASQSTSSSLPSFSVEVINGQNSATPFSAASNTSLLTQNSADIASGNVSPFCTTNIFATGSSSIQGSTSTGISSVSPFTSSSTMTNGTKSIFPNFSQANTSSSSVGLSVSSVSPLFGGSSVSNVPGSFGLSSSAGTVSAPLFSSTVQFGSNSVPSTTSGSVTSFGGNSTMTFASGSIPALESGSSSTFGLGSLTGANSTSTVMLGTSPTFGLGSSTGANNTSTVAFGVNSSPSLDSTSTPPFGNNNALTFGSGSVTSAGTNSSPAPSFGLSGTTATGSNSSLKFGTGSAQSAGTKSSFTFGSSSIPSAGISSSPSFGLNNNPVNSSPSFGLNGTPSFGSNSTPSFGLNSSQSFGSTNAPLFGSGSASSFGAGSAPSFGAGSMPSFGISTSSAPSTVGSTSGSFVFGQPVASVSTTSTPVFGSSFGTSTSSSAFSFGGATSAGAPTSSAFSFGGATSASAPSSSAFPLGGATSASAPSFGAPVNSSTGSSFTFGGSNPTPSFNFASDPTTFGSTPSPSPQGDQMEDNMAEDTHVSTPAIPTPNFGISTQTAAAPSPFLFGSQAAAPGMQPPSTFQFGGQQSTAPNPFAGNAPSTFTQGGSGLEFSGGGFSLGASGGGEKAGRKFIKAKRDKAKRR